ncbi:MAG: Amuc_1100 family pilus-like protein [Kiritimatiellaeota bacterium]|nr:Amuc_1100 family pilus-like protein [Kiritimatiellota bacterium]
MQKIKKIVAIGGGIIVIILGVAGYFIVNEVLRSSRFINGRDSAERELKKYYAGNPFPNDENIRVKQEGVERVKENWLLALQDVAARDFPTNAVNFSSRCEQMINELHAAAPEFHRGEKVVAAGFGFGFDRYTKSGEQPKPEDVARLVEQTYIIERLIQEVYDSGVRKITAVTRDDFEGGKSAGAPSSGSGGPQRGGPPVGRPANIVDVTAANSPVPATCEKVTLALEMSEANVIDLLNRLGAMPLFTVVTRVDVQKDPKSDMILPAMTDSRGGDIDGPPPTRQDRTVSGRLTEAPAKVTIDVEVYRFLGEI